MPRSAQLSRDAAGEAYNVLTLSAFLCAVKGQEARMAEPLSSRLRSPRARSGVRDVPAIAVRCKSWLGLAPSLSDKPGYRRKHDLKG
jgi:hypothetical protein